ncbi:family 20 glycosylhydrolase [Bacteroides sp. 519]|uniref:glycoside hydrolase family 20 protein n=1 Tax=Bacteroides sp. 519 TaxID=2302937 RepID=UPI0013D09EC8|nr:family 20 glycosylhydrolase [Bacteroides sp. 519]NDV60059.1 beta-N-acetylhexosaminidase [Bacteroides sp. 519]
MLKLKHTLPLWLLFVFVACETKTVKNNYQVIPLPQEITYTNGGSFFIRNSTQISFPTGNSELQSNAEFLARYIREITGKQLKVIPLSDSQIDNAIILTVEDDIENPEGYRLTVNSKEVKISGKTPTGVFYGIQTLRKSLPIEKDTDIELLPVEINDYPRFKHRGMHLDVGRHFFSTEFIKTYLDMLALHNMNNFHWHLTEDQGWRIEIKKYPRLTEIGATRKETVIGRNSGEYDGKPYAGFYTQEEIKDIVAYAAERYINVIPEIDFPGHTLAALTAYPEFGCTGGPYEVATSWGVFKDVICIGNENAMTFLEDVLDEVLELFPSKIIHIGGDEAPRDRWKECPQCKARIKAEGLMADAEHTAEDRLQSYCMARMEKFLNNRGRSIIGWDEILEGDVAPNATVMSWRGMEGGIKASQLGHDVIMTPANYVYFDYQQTADLTNEPTGIGGFVDVEKVYSLEPMPSDLTNEEKNRIIGVQANLWTEYVSTPEHAEYMVLPRMAALCEVQWLVPEKKDYRDFAQRLLHLLDIYDLKGYNYAKHILNLKARYLPNPTDKSIQVELYSINNSPIYYTLDGSEPDNDLTPYQEPIVVKSNACLQAITVVNPDMQKVLRENICFNKATLKPITLTYEPAEAQRYAGAITLVDGLSGSDNSSTGRWLGFYGTGMEAIIDLEEPTEISNLSTRVNIDVYAWSMGPTEISISVSDDNNNFKKIASEAYPEITDIAFKKIEAYNIQFDPVTTRYIKVIMKPSKGMPKGHRGEGRTPYLYVDEIGVD